MVAKEPSLILQPRVDTATAFCGIVKKKSTSLCSHSRQTGLDQIIALSAIYKKRIPTSLSRKCIQQISTKGIVLAQLMKGMICTEKSVFPLKTVS